MTFSHIRSCFLGVVLTLSVISDAHADPVSIAVAGYLFGAGTLVAGTVVTSIVTAVWTTALLIGASYLSASLQGKPEEPIGASSGKLQGGGLVTRSAIFGRGMTAGSLVYANTFGYAGNTPNAYLVQVIALQDLPATALAEIWVNGEKSAWNAGATAETEGIPVPFGSVSGGQGGGSTANHMWVRFYNGSQIAADARLVTLFGANPDRPYESTRIGTGIAYVVVTTLVNEELFQGFPELKFALDGVKLYDQRLDTTQGGSGAHRLTDPTTWAHTRNPVVIAANIVLGIQYADRWVYGAQTVAQPQLPTASWFAAANECDAAIDLAAGGTEPQFQAGGEILFNQQPADTIEALLKSCNGRLAEIGGVYKIRAGAAGASVIAFTDADIYSSEQQTYDPFVGLGQTINAVNGRYISAAEGWELKDAVALLDADLELADGGRRQSVDVVYGFVSSGTAVQRLMRSERDTNRAWRRHTLPMPPDMYVAEPLDVVSWTSTRNGYVNKTFEIVAAEDDLDMVVSLKELDPTSYDWDQNVHEGTVNEGTITYLSPQAQPIIAPAAEGIVIEANGRQLAGLLLTWDPTVTDVDGILYEVRLASDQVVVLTSQTDYWDRGALKTSQNLVGNTNYEARLKYRAASARQTTYSGWLAFTTPDVRISQDELSAQLDAKIRQVDEQLVGYIEQSRLAVDDLVANLHGHLTNLREVQGRTMISLGANFEENSAAVTLAMEAIANAEESLAAFIVTVTTNYATNTSVTSAKNEAISVAQSNAAGSIAAAINSLATVYQTISNTTSLISTAKNEAISVAQSNAAGSIAAAINSLTTVYETIGASTTKIATAKTEAISVAQSNATSAIAAAITSLEAVYETISNSTTKIATAKGEAITTAQSNATDAIAIAINSLSATYETINNSISRISTAKTEAISVATANADSALSAFINSVFATSGSGTASGRIRFIAASAPSGVVASFAIEINLNASGAANWFTSGLYFDVMNGFARFRVVANLFEISEPSVNGGVPFSMFSVSNIGGQNVLVFNGLAYITKIIADTIETQHLKVGSAAREVRTTLGGETSFNFTSDRQIVSVVLSTTTGEVQVSWETSDLALQDVTESPGDPTGGRVAEVYLKVDGTERAKWKFSTSSASAYGFLTGGGQNFGRRSEAESHGVAVTGLSNANHTFTLHIRIISSQGSQIGNGSMHVQELKAAR